jgi:hypothetical protein
MTQLKGPDISRSLFGGVFDIDGAGLFPGLELINLIVCGEGEMLPGEEIKKIWILRHSHDFARKLVTDHLTPALKSQVLMDDHSQIAVAHLLRCLELGSHSKVRAKSWERIHFFPYTRSLVHWDARQRKNKTSDIHGERTQIERRYLRGGGAYAYSVLRLDQNLDRLDSIRRGFASLYPKDFSSPLESLAAALLKHGESDSVSVPDQMESISLVKNDVMDNLYREGMFNILNNDSCSVVQRIRAIMNWTGIWLVLLEAYRSSQFLGKQSFGIILDCAGAHSQLRRASQKCLKEQLLNIEQAAESKAIQENGTITKPQINKIKGFFSNTAAACGLLNSLKGRRHFTIKLIAIEALVLAATDKAIEQSFENFVSNWLGDRCGLIIGSEAASKAGMLEYFDATIFEENERQLAEQMKAAGMLQVYSDATRMVSPGANQ